MSSPNRSTMLIAVAVTFLMTAFLFHRPDIQAQSGRPRADQAAQIQALQDAVAQLSVVSPPVGTVMAYAGEWDRAKEEELGWMLCDGRRLKSTEFSELFRVLRPNEQQYEFQREDGSFILPNFQGAFLRGIDKSKSRDPEGDQRHVGHFQGEMLAKHRHHVRLEGGEHEHDYTHYGRNRGDEDDDEEKWFYVNKDASTSRTSGGGKHVHDGFTGAGEKSDEPDGGGVETRPDNCAVYWIIKYRSELRAATAATK